MLDKAAITETEGRVDQGQTPCAIPVALQRVTSYNDPSLPKIIASLLDNAHFRIPRGARVLVKPNLLRAVALACTDPSVVAAVCSWLLDQGAHVVVADSPGFGRLSYVASSVGLTKALAPLHLSCSAMEDSVWKTISVCGKSLKIPVARTALDCDCIISVPKLKAHSQLGLTMAVKNCFGCVPGMHKACMHTLYGKNGELFAGALAALYDLLPPVAGVVDGICAMHITGPGNGQPYPLQLVGASSSALALDRVLTQIVGKSWDELPLGQALKRRLPKECQRALVYPLSTPAEWSALDFVVPTKLLTMSFAPHRLFVSLVRRFFAKFAH